jgi:hypothetical protein
LEPATILIVRHGKGRGRHRRYMQEALDHLRRHRPAVHQHLVFHATGEPFPALDGVGSVVFWLADPLRELYPACYEEAVRLAKEARARGIRLINPPEALSNSIKSTQARLWREAGIPTPTVERFEDYAALTSAVERLVFPMLVRGDERHAQRGACVFHTADDVFDADAEKLPWPCAVSPLVDVRTSYRHDTAFAQLFHKKRLIVANGAIRTKHTFFSSDPIVSAATCIFGQHMSWYKMGFSSNLSSLELKCIEHDLAYWRRVEEHRNVMLRACNVLGFDIAAIDYSNLADGSPVLWEANPYFQLPKLREMMLPLYRKAIERVASYHEAICDFLGGLTHERSANEDRCTVSAPTAD